MKIISWNVNWIRAVVKKWFLDFIKKENPDILCLQETKAFEEQFVIEVWLIDWYDYVWHSWIKPWYAWTAIFFKSELSDRVVDKKSHFWEIMHFHDEWRVTEIKFDNFTLINCYFPNWWAKADWTDMLPFKFEFYDKLMEYCEEKRKNWESIIITWDFNICHQEIDIARPKENWRNIWFTPEERQKLWEFLSKWYIDVFRYLNPDAKWYYTWWSYRWWARQKNIWRRLDYFLVSEDLIWKVKNMEHLDKQLGSDHCPIVLDIDL